MNIGMILKWGSIFMGMVQDPNIHMLGRGAWAGIKRLRTAMDPSHSSSSASPVPNMNRSALKQRGLQGSPGTSNLRQLPAAPGMGRMPSEAEMRRMMEEMGIQPRGHQLQRVQGMPGHGGVPMMPDYQRPNNPSLFPWMEQSSNATGKKQQKRKSRKR